MPTMHAGTRLCVKNYNGKRTTRCTPTGTISPREAARLAVKEARRLSKTVYIADGYNNEPVIECAPRGGFRRRKMHFYSACSLTPGFRKRVGGR